MDQFSHIYKCDVNCELETFLQSEPTMHDFQLKFAYLQNFEERMDQEPDHYVVGALFVGLEDFKRKIRNILNLMKKASYLTSIRIFK